ncbi:winged helix DNA-binding protein [Cupriavidus taiwanensis]|uniref:Putative transcription regulator, contains HTH domain (MarR family) n=1 Tax=Cupriavidus taiwanensis TaxID=164546 RepID=A0A7Z7JGJ6_9BURK|nr:winged helix DNA-binding protein [Cupriavidus taiwanensis]SOZ19515.1 putative transcription regulator, contains HTH domain (MarR family) [Cupriavidus taiwanensis]SOZ97297.1 putative transcription regulator, contains HTH domain (MarR family) [Cupriavidus taiwanensis]SPC26186.1 putative transcription regulator, contains HTH domain (MarR family) [Cupriavidus taiwanensis]SPD37682.1 putative transcription regulator, contains HTH domain (MarR family) [Cupriavidus taiwanensis]
MSKSEEAVDLARLPILTSSAQLVVEGSESSSEFEFGMIVAWNSFSRWAERCMAAAGAPELTMTEIILMNHIKHRARQKKLADICFTLNFSDTHVVAYGLRKLVALELVQAEKIGKEVFYSTTEKGDKLAERYKHVRTTCLVPSLDETMLERLGSAAALLRQMSGNFDQAARSAASL